MCLRVSKLTLGALLVFPYRRMRKHRIRVEADRLDGASLADRLDGASLGGKTHHDLEVFLS